MHRIVLACFSGTLLALASVASPAQAQQRPAAPPAAPGATPAATPAPAANGPVPDRTVAQYGDWFVACTQVSGQRACEMNHTITNSNGQTVAVLAFGRPAREQPLRFVVQVAANVRVSQPLRLVLDAEATLTYTWCNRLICVVELDLPDEVIPRRFRARAADQPARLIWWDGADNELAYPVPVRGFSAAWDELMREAG
jgi:invasion protein IalB